MSYNPIDPYERYRADRIEADRQGREPAEEVKPPSWKVAAYLLSLFHRALDLFKETDTVGIEVRGHLREVKEALEVLKREDRSQDSPFLNQMSVLWHKILEDSLRFRKEMPLTGEFRAFIKSIDRYPEGEEFPFGYYLIEYAGQKWLPFPYMELVQKLHDEHQKNPSASTLSRWTEMIDALAKKMDSRYNPGS